MSEKYKAHIRIPTVQYGYVEVTLEDTPEGIFEANRNLLVLYGPKSGIDKKEMNTVIDKMLLGQSVEGGIELYERMSDDQKFATQTLKRGLDRIKSKEVTE